MRKHAMLAAIALCALGGSLTAVKAAGPLEAEAASLPFTDTSNGAELPRFQPSAEIGAEAGITFADATAEDEAEEIGEGQASWYGAQFAGRATASGERFNPAELTAAHRTLPLGSKVRVTYGDRSVVVRINDRGPFHGNRVIDLSEAAAEEIGLRRAGSGRVKLARLAS